MATLKDLGQTLFNHFNKPRTSWKVNRSNINPRWSPADQFRAAGDLIGQGIQSASQQDRVNTPQRLASQFLTNFNNWSTLGATRNTGFTPQSNLERGAAVAGGVTALINPLNPMNKALGGLDALGMGVTSRVLPRTLPQLAQRITSHVGGELAQTAGIGALRAYQGEEFDPVTDLAFGLGARAGFGAPGVVSQMGKVKFKQALNTLKGQKGAIELPNPFAKGVDLPPAKPINKILRTKVVQPKEGIYRNPSKITSESLIEGSGGWKPGMREKFDLAMFNNDAKSVKELLPDVPAPYRAQFAEKIAKIIDPSNKPTNPIFSLINNEQGFVRLGKNAKDQEMVTLYHASPKLPTSGNWRKGTFFAPDEQNARYYAESHHRGDIKVQRVQIPRSLLFELPSNGNFRLKEEYPVSDSRSVMELINNESGFVRLGGDQVPQKFDTAKFQVTPQQTKTLTNLQKTLGLDTRKVRSFEEMKAAAAELGTDPKKLLSDLQNKRITDSEVIALGQQIRNSTDRISSLTKQLKRNPNDQAIREKLTAEEGLLNQAIAKRITGGTEAGRAVVAFKQLANKTLDPAYWLDKAQRQLGRDRALKADEIDAINDLIKSKDTLGLANFISGLGESTMREKMVGLWKAGLLTGFRTHEANVISNTGMGVLETLKDIPATGFDIARVAIKGGYRSKAFTLGEITAQPKGAIRGIKQAKDYLKTGLDPREIQRAELYRKLRFGDTRGGKVAQRFTDTVFGTLGAEDKVFREAAFNRSMMEQLNVARTNGQIDPNIVRQVQADPNGVFNSPIVKQLQERAAQDAAHATFTKENAVASAIAGFRAGGNAGTKFVSDVTMPFVKTPTNVAEALFDYSPAGFVKDVIKKALNTKSVDDRRLAESFGRATVGSVIVALGYILAEHGMVRGSEEPYNTAANAQDRLAQTPGNSVFVGGEWRKIDRVSPLGNLLVLGAEAYKNGGDIAKTGFGALKSLTEQTFLKGLSGGLEAINNPEQSAASYVESTVSSVIPTLSADLARGLDASGNKRDTSDGLTARVMSRLPGWRNELPEKLNSLGEPEPEPNGFLGSLFDPFNSTEPNNDPLVSEFNRVGYDLNYVGRKIGKEELAPNIQREYQKRAGEQIQKIVPPIIASGLYQKMDIDKQRSAIEKAVNQAKDKARDSIKADMKSGKLKADAGFISSASAREFENSPDAPQDFLSRAGLYGQAFLTDPGAAWKGLTTEEVLRKINNDAVIFEREKFLNPPGGTMQLDHTISLFAGGDNSPENLRYYPPEVKAQKDRLENQLFRQLSAGEINKEQARQQLADWVSKNGTGSPTDTTMGVPKITSGVTTPTITDETMITDTKETIDEIKKAMKLEDAESIVNLGGEVIGNGAVKLGSTLIYPENGSIKTLDLDFDIKEPKLTGSELLDKKLISSYNSKLTSAQGRVQKLYELGYIDAEIADQMLAKLQKPKKTSGKGKKSKGRISIRSSAVKRAQTVKLRQLEQPKIEIPKLRSLKGGKIKTDTRYKVKGFKNTMNSGRVLL